MRIGFGFQSIASFFIFTLNIKVIGALALSDCVLCFPLPLSSLGESRSGEDRGKEAGGVEGKNCGR